MRVLPVTAFDARAEVGKAKYLVDVLTMKSGHGVKHESCNSQGTAHLRRANWFEMHLPVAINQYAVIYLAIEFVGRLSGGLRKDWEVEGRRASCFNTSRARI